MSTRATIINTVAASVAAPIVCLAISAVAGGLFALMQTLLTVLRPGIIGFFAVIVGTYAGMVTARTMCDKFLTPYHTQVVFGAFTVLIGLGAALMILYRPVTSEQINSYVQLIALALMAYIVFWKHDDI